LGNRSRQNLAALVFDRNVRAEYHGRDRCGREVSKILDGSRDVEFEPIRARYAWWYRAYANEQTLEDREHYESADGGPTKGRSGYGATRAWCCLGSGNRAVVSRPNVLLRLQSTAKK